VQDEDDLNVKDSNKVIKNKKINAKSFKQLNKLESIDNSDDNIDGIMDNNYKKTSRRNKRRSSGR
jgi:hypothetical protein